MLKGQTEPALRLGVVPKKKAGCCETGRSRRVVDKPTDADCKARRYCFWQEWGCWPSTGSSATIPVSGLAWRNAYLAPVSCRALHLSFCDGGYQYVHDEARVGRKNHQIRWGRWRCEDALHRAAGNLSFQEPRPKSEQDGPVDYRRGPDDQRQRHL